ncbi:LCP family protein [Demequina sp. SYSU T00039]|uniref:LCP family protein n=1 Tax=Demequina lignilytica TaxID=3051663 RepID=A0AAW7M9V1_9MICO|nr:MULTISPECIES: LCP family protein [unclassified Demequina]MDN4478263.1 LCP family protein [Demequina sp. SYSU T00039-1]MDN4488287.1 LCP family protein [Demequina sp. SYSU T00039]MDN4490166.1 LCP family protein [Demequina sp. SYSU T00068]
MRASSISEPRWGAAGIALAHAYTDRQDGGRRRTMLDEVLVAARHSRGDRWRRWLWWGAMAGVAVLGFLAVYANTLVTQLDTTLTANAQDVDHIVGARPSKSATPTDGAAGEPLTILLMGSDTRIGAGNQAVGGGDVEGMRNDTTILVHVSGDRTRIDAVSIPRDAQVEIPECTYLDGGTHPGGTGDFNIAFSNGGAQGNAAEAAACTIKTVEQLTGVYIDHYAVADFDGFIRMVDAIGGVPMCIPTRIVSREADLDLEAGPQILDGHEALGYARLRKAEVGGVSGSDLQRVTRQQQLLSQVARTVLAKNLLTDVGDLTQFVRAAAESLTMDPELADTSYIIGLAYALRGIDPGEITFATVPWQYTPDFLDVELLPEAEQMWDDIRNDRPLSVTAEGDASSAWDDGRKTSETPAPAASTDPDDGDGGSGSGAADLLLECR